MNILKSFKNGIFKVTDGDFEQRALDLFYFQAQQNGIYKKYLKGLKRNPDTIRTIEEIPFLPIEFFKFHQIKTSSWNPEAVFESSATTNPITSKHYIEDMKFYESVSKNIFSLFYGKPDDYDILALLPSYLERSNASLIAMFDYLIKQSNSTASGFYLNNKNELIEKIYKLKDSPKKKLLVGVTFALLDLAQEFDVDLGNFIVMETGGMKGRREEMVRAQVHEILKSKFNLKNIHSEYGMTELLSQAYATVAGVFTTPPWMKVMIRDLNDPFNFLGNYKNGGINIIDLANVHSCAFIETNDIGFCHADKGFEVLGRFDNSDIRGCNLMASIS